MKCFYAPETETHDPLFRLTYGKIQRNAEQAERARLLLAGLDALSLSVTAPAPAPQAALEAVHTKRFLDFLETACPMWSPALPHHPIPKPFWPVPAGIWAIHPPRSASIAGGQQYAPPIARLRQRTPCWQALRTPMRCVARPGIIPVRKLPRVIVF